MCCYRQTFVCACVCVRALGIMLASIMLIRRRVISSDNWLSRNANHSILFMQGGRVLTGANPQLLMEVVKFHLRGEIRFLYGRYPVVTEVLEQILCIFGCQFVVASHLACWPRLLAGFPPVKYLNHLRHGEVSRGGHKPHVK